MSTGSTAARIAEAGVAVTKVEDLTGFPECLDGRVKTLHPTVHAGILADLRLESHRAQLDELGIEPFDLVVSNLYPFLATVASGATHRGVHRADRHRRTLDGARRGQEPRQRRHRDLARRSTPIWWPRLQPAGPRSAQRQRLAAAAFAHTATYDVQVAEWFAQEVTADPDVWWPSFAGQTLELKNPLRYGENAHQAAALYVDRGSEPGLAQADLLGGKEMSYNNYVDAGAAHRAAYDFSEPAVAIIKHTNPCGLAVGADVAEAHRKAHACDPVSAFGGVIAVNRPVSVEMAEQVAEIFTEVIVAPGYDDGARRGADREEEPARASLRSAASLAGRVAGGLRRGVGADRGPIPGRRRRPVALDAWLRRGAGRRRTGGAWRSPGEPAGR